MSWKPADGKTKKHWTLMRAKEEFRRFFHDNYPERIPRERIESPSWERKKFSRELHCDVHGILTLPFPSLPFLLFTFFGWLSRCPVAGHLGRVVGRVALGVGCESTSRPIGFAQDFQFR